MHVWLLEAAILAKDTEVEARMRSSLREKFGEEAAQGVHTCLHACAYAPNTWSPVLTGCMCLRSPDAQSGTDLGNAVRRNGAERPDPVHAAAVEQG